MESKLLGFLANNLIAGLDAGTLKTPRSVEAVVSEIEESRFVELIDQIDPMLPGSMIPADQKAEINRVVLERWEMRRFKYAGASKDPIYVCLGFITNLIASPPD